MKNQIGNNNSSIIADTIIVFNFHLFISPTRPRQRLGAKSRNMKALSLNDTSTHGEHDRKVATSNMQKRQYKSLCASNGSTDAASILKEKRITKVNPIPLFSIISLTISA